MARTDRAAARAYCTNRAHPPANRSTYVPECEKENPGALAGATGENKKAGELLGNHTRKRPELATAEWAKGLALSLDRRNRAAFTFAALCSLGPDDAALMAASVIGTAGSPLPPFLAPMHCARFWASIANRQELKAYAVASYEAMRSVDQAAFLDHVQGRTGA